MNDINPYASSSIDQPSNYYYDSCANYLFIALPVIIVPFAYGTGYALGHLTKKYYADAATLRKFRVDVQEDLRRSNAMAVISVPVWSAIIANSGEQSWASLVGAVFTCSTISRVGFTHAILSP